MNSALCKPEFQPSWRSSYSLCLINGQMESRVIFKRLYSIKSVIKVDNFFGLRVWNITVITLHVYMYRYMLLVVISQISMGTPTGASILSIISTDCLSITDLAQWHIDPPTFKTFSQNSSYLCKICFCLTREWICCPKLHAWRKSQGMHYCDTINVKGV